jgi:uncharacterized membrane protein YgdD (TMEM256/DUF423 family)
MSTPIKTLLCFAGLSLLAATISGAIASHVLTGLDAQTLHSFETAVDFQFFQALGLIGIALVVHERGGNRALWAAAWLVVVGSVLFCGGIYAVTLGAPRGVLSVTPYGGVALMIAWLLFAVGVWLRRN